MQKRYALLLLGCFILPLFATYAWLRFERKCIKREVKQEILGKIALKDCSRFEFTYQQEVNLDWEHSAEFSIKGQKYDVILKKKTASGTTIYYCWKDVKESAIDKEITSVVNDFLGGNPAKDKQHKSVTHLAKDLPVEEPTYIFEVISVENFLKGGNYNRKPQVSYLNVSVPPPDCLEFT